MGNMLGLVGTGLLETIYMTLGSTVIAYIIGLPVGLLLVVTDKEGIRPHLVLNRTVGIIVNILRSVPFIILLVWVMPVTRAIMGTTIGSKATVVPLVISAAPFVARMVESSAKEVDRGVIEATISMGASTMQIVRKVLMPEAKPSLIIGAAIAITTVLGYSAMAGIVGGGGLGAIAINYGYYRSNSQIMLLMVIVLVVIVQIFQEIGGRLSNKTDKRIR
ncbi:MAG: ABC transporter permease [Oscillospiraceae bacterium]|nr:ABC transporter permease [Oscillospiraceae bacterium]